MANLKDVYHKDTYRFHQPPDSYWRATTTPVEFPALTENTEADVAIIGGGVTGLLAALRLAKEFGKDVVVLEAGSIGWGASGRAGGFNSGMASKLSVTELHKKFGLEATREFAAEQDRATDLVYEIAEAEQIEMDVAGSGVFVSATSGRAAMNLREDVQIYKETVGKEVEYLGREDFHDRVHKGKFVWGGLHIPGGSGIHPLKYTLGIAKAAKQYGARIFESSRVTAWKKSGDKHLLKATRGAVIASRVIVATNAYSSDRLIPKLDRRMLPLISSILVTRPLETDELERAGYSNHTPVYTSNNKLFYYRLLPDNRFLIGGRGDTIGSVPAGARNAYWLEQEFRSLFPAWQEVEIAYNWSGLVCVTQRGVPALGCLPEDPSVGYGFGCHGSGLNNATWMGHEIAGVMASKDTIKAAQTLPKIVQSLPPRFFGPRRTIINTALMAYSAIDAWNNRPIWRE
ncbi:MAG: FAD-binding oxidoreductase [Pseudomonadota bacterium]